MTEVPAETPVTTPVPAITVATEGVALLHVPPAVALLKVVVVPEHRVVVPVIRTGFGFTVTVIVNGAPTQPPPVEVGVTIYSTDPAVASLGLVSIWLMVDPDPALAPVIPSTITPIDHVKLLVAEAVRPIFGPVPLHVVDVAKLVTEGIGFTVMVALPDIGLEQVGVFW
jgi:hypothetical protein